MIFLFRYFPCVIGCLDGCHLEFQVGPQLKPFYLNHKSYYSINLMAIVTYNMSFLDIFVDWPGRSHDSRCVVRQIVPKSTDMNQYATNHMALICL